MSILAEILIISLACLGLFTVTHDGMLLEPIRLWIDSKVPATGFLRGLYKPVLGCPICYASVWGSLLHFSFSGINQLSLLYWLPVIFSVAFVNSTLLAIKQNFE